jgi:hypothetical protein
MSYQLGTCSYRSRPRCFALSRHARPVAPLCPAALRRLIDTEADDIVVSVLPAAPPCSAAFATRESRTFRCASQ